MEHLLSKRLKKGLAGTIRGSLTSSREQQNLKLNLIFPYGNNEKIDKLEVQLRKWLMMKKFETRQITIGRTIEPPKSLVGTGVCTENQK